MKTLNVNTLINDFATVASTETYEFATYDASKSSLKRRADMMLPKIKFLMSEQLIDDEHLTLCFNNTAPETGGSFDDVEFYTMNDDVLKGAFCFQTWGHLVGGQAYFTTRNDDGTYTKTEFANWKEMKHALKNDEELRSKLRSIFNPDYVAPKSDIVEDEPKKKKAAAPKKAKKVKDKKPVEPEVVSIDEDDLDAHIPAKRVRKKVIKVDKIADNVAVIDESSVA